MPEYDATVVYKDIPGRPGYKAGSDGTIWSEWKQVRSSRPTGFDTIRSGEWRERQTVTGKRYRSVWLSGKVFDVHNLILRVFVGPPPEGMECCHADGNKSNNELSNLRWDTKKANWADKRKHGTASVGEKQGHAKLTKAQVVAMRKEYESGLATQVQLSAKYGVCQSAVSSILRRQTWACV